MKRLFLFLLLALGATSPSSVASAAESAKIVEVKKIWDQAPHNAFTDLVHWQGRWFCVFREGKAHVSPDGALRVITSVDGNQWESAALLTSTNSDLRDAKITVTPDNRLMLAGAEAVHDKSKHTHQSLAWFSEDGRKWSEKHEIGDPNFWLWRVTWHKGSAYGVGYGCGQEKSLRLYSSKDGKKFDTLVERLLEGGYPNETSIVFDGDTAYCLLRRDGKSENTGLLGIAHPPYTQWEWKDLGARIGGPHMLRLPDGRYVTAVRWFKNKTATALCWLDPQAGKLTEIVTLPSGGDTSYPGLVFHEGLLWVSYYSSHEGKTNIYLAKVQLPAQSEIEAKENKPATDGGVRDIGSRRELFVDDYLLSKRQNVELKMQLPVPQDVAITCDAPWEGNTSAYYTLFADGDRFRMYYRGSHHLELRKLARPENVCYAESRDGLKWEKPKLGVCEFEGSKENNIVWNGKGSHNFTPFKDGNPKCDADAKYKAFASHSKGLHAYKSPDGIRWTQIGDAPVITNGAFDSQNLVYWDALRGEYRAYWRFFSKEMVNGKVVGTRAIRTATSRDFLKWENEADLAYGDAPNEHLYTNAIEAYVRAPHIFLGFPTRYQPKNSQVEPVLMTSRDGVNFKRWPEPLIPITAPKDRDGNRSNYMARGLLQLPGKDREVSVYATEAYYTGSGSRVRRFTFRTDGFVSLNAGTTVGEAITHPLQFKGKELSLNLVTSGSGSVRVEVQDKDGKPIAGFSADDCDELKGDEIEMTVKWKNNSDISKLAGQPVQLRLILKDADVFSMKFNP